ncbi:MAG: hypothetical protein ACFCBW_15545, partial [Candidatus Competibacterales bacterium]
AESSWCPGPWGPRAAARDPPGAPPCRPTPPAGDDATPSAIPAEPEQPASAATAEVDPPAPAAEATRTAPDGEGSGDEAVGTATPDTHPPASAADGGAEIQPVTGAAQGTPPPSAQASTSHQDSPTPPTNTP